LRYAVWLLALGVLGACGGSEAPAPTEKTQLEKVHTTASKDDASLAPAKSDPLGNHIRFVNDFDGNGTDDILWQTAGGATHISFMDGARVSRCAPLGTFTDTLMGTGDFNGDGKPDTVWRNMSTGAVRIGLMNGRAITAFVNVSTSPIALNVKLEAVGDFDGNGRADILWRNQSTGRSVMSYHAADGTVSSWLLVSNFIALNTSALKVGDINGDDRDDIVWRNNVTGNVVISLMNGPPTSWVSITSTPIALNVKLEAIGDFDGNGQADLLWRNITTGNSLMSYHNTNGTVASWPVVSSYINPSTTSAQGVGDFDADGADDILWRNLSTGNTVASLMDGHVPNWQGFGFSACPTRAVPHTGVNVAQCYRAGSDTLLSCGSDARALNAHQDGMRFFINPMTYSEVFAFNTFVGPINYTRTSCVRDDVTGLIWEGKEASGTRAGSNIYTHLGGGAATDASGYVAVVNASGLCGFTDWRLPTRQELLSLVDYGNASGAPINTTWFPNTALANYWSADGLSIDSAQAWYVSSAGSGGGTSVTRARSTAYAVRLVRGSAASGPRYSYSTVAYGSDGANNVVNDAWTGLQWRRCEQGRIWSGIACTGSESTYTHEQALAHARDQAGWRLSNVKELSSLVELSVSSGARISPVAFPGATTRWHWTSSPYVGYTSGAWNVDFSDGFVYDEYRDSSGAVRLVRVSR
jgi:hypothetical protein